MKKNELRMSTVSLFSTGSLSHRYLNHKGGGVGGGGSASTTALYSLHEQARVCTHTQTYIHTHSVMKQ